MEERDCTQCKYAVQIAEHEWECTAEEYDIDEKSCFKPKE